MILLSKIISTIVARSHENIEQAATMMAHLDCSNIAQAIYTFQLEVRDSISDKVLSTKEFKGSRLINTDFDAIWQVYIELGRKWGGKPYTDKSQLSGEQVGVYFVDIDTIVIEGYTPTCRLEMEIEQGDKDDTVIAESVQMD